MSIDFLVTTLIIVALPGTGAIYTMAAGIGRGHRASILAALACTFGIVPHLIAAMTGLAAIMHSSAVVFQSLKYLGVVYLIYMAWATWQERGALTIRESSVPVSARQVLTGGIVLNLLNPKLTIFFFAFLPQFVHTSGYDARKDMVTLSLIFMSVTFIVFALYGLSSAWLRRRIVSSPRAMLWIRRTFAASFVALGAKLAVTGK